MFRYVERKIESENGAGVRILLIINVVVFIIQQIFPVFTDIFSFHSFSSPAFKPFQLVTYMFLHSTRDFGHIFGNMLGLFFFGPILEQHVLGSKRFLTLYLVSGIGAGVLYVWMSLFFARNMEFFPLWSYLTSTWKES